MIPARGGDAICGSGSGEVGHALPAFVANSRARYNTRVSLSTAVTMEVTTLTIATDIASEVDLDGRLNWTALPSNHNGCHFNRSVGRTS